MTDSPRRTVLRIAILAAWALALALLVPAAGRAPDVLQVNARIEGSESAEVDRLLAEDFGSPLASSVVLLVAGVPPAATPEGWEVLGRVVHDVETLPEVGATLSFLNAPDPALSGDGEGSIVVVGIADGVEPDQAIPLIREALVSTTEDLRPAYPGARLHLTGEAALNFDLRNTGAAEASAGERRVLPVAAVLLVLAFGTVVAALLPVVSGAIAISLALGLAVHVARIVPLSILLLNVVSMIGLGLGIDYALLVVHRWREPGGRGKGLRAAAGTIALSGAAVAVGFAALLTIPLNELRSVAVGGLLAVAASVLLATTLLPALLGILGPGVELGRIDALVRRRRLSRTRKGWERWARWVVRHPILVLAVAVPPLIVLSAQAARLRTGIPPGDWLPPNIESGLALDELETMGRGGVVQSIRVVIELPEETGALSHRGFAAVRRATRAVARIPEVADVRSLATAVPPGVSPHAAMQHAPEVIRRNLFSPDERLAQIEVTPRDGLSPSALDELVAALREAGPARLTGIEGTRMWVGGLPAFNADFKAAVVGRFLPVVLLVIGATLVTLMIGFRSVLIPLKAVVLNLLSVAGAFGALVLVFQDGLGIRLLGLSSVPGSVFAMVPVLVFCVVFGLSMDYEVFLVARVAEARRSRDESEAVIEGLAQTGHVITSAAAIMVVVFGGFTLGDFVLMKMLGFALATAVLLDAAIVRVAIGPALLVLLGRWNWWPGGAGLARRSGGRGVATARDVDGLPCSTR